MTEDEFAETPVGRSTVAYTAYMQSLMGSVNQADIGRVFAVGAYNAIAKLANQQTMDREKTGALLHALYIIGSWGAFEAFFDDFMVAVLTSAPERLNEDSLRDVKVPISDLLTDGEDRQERVYLALKLRTERATGVKKFETMLKHVDLNGVVPDDIRAAVHESQQIRHVWAHKAGIADVKFVKAAGHLGFSQGQQVAIENTQCRMYIAALTIYGLIIMNRFRRTVGLHPVQGSAGPTAHPLFESYNNLYV